MDLNSTPFISYSEIKIEATDLFEDAWGFNSEFHDVISQLGEIDTRPVDIMADRLIRAISRHN